MFLKHLCNQWTHKKEVCATPWCQDVVFSYPKWAWMPIWICNWLFQESNFVVKTSRKHRSIHLLNTEAHGWRCSFKKGVLENFAKFTVKHQCWISFLKKAANLWLTTLLPRDSDTGFFLWILEKLLWTLLLQNTSTWLPLWIPTFQICSFVTFMI